MSNSFVAETVCQLRNIHQFLWQQTQNFTAARKGTIKADLEFRPFRNGCLLLQDGPCSQMKNERDSQNEALICRFQGRSREYSEPQASRSLSPAFSICRMMKPIV